MMSLFSFFSKLLGQNENTYTNNRKRRFTGADIDNFREKIRRTTNMYSDDWVDAASCSQKPYLKSYRRNSIRTPSMRNGDTIVIDDENDVHEMPTPPPATAYNGYRADKRQEAYNVLRRAHNRLKSCRLALRDPARVADVFRPQETITYRNMLLQSPTTAAVYREEAGSSFNINRRLFTPSDSRIKASSPILDKKPTSVIDLTDEKSSGSGKDSVESDVEIVSVKRKIQPVNSYKKTLESVPEMNPKYLEKLEEDYQNRLRTRGRFIEEEQKKLLEYSNVNKENMMKLLTQRVDNCKLRDVILLDEDEADELRWPVLSDEQEAKIKEALSSRSHGRVFIEKFNLRVTGADLKTLNDKEWLNDEVINFYVNLIQERSQRNGLPKVYSMSTFFYPKLISSGYSSLRRWTKRVDIFSYDILVVPVHLTFHWCMAIIDFRDKSIRYYDSMRGNNLQCLSALESYLQDESLDKKKRPFDTSDWKKEVMKDIPRQMNGSDCGVFSCTFAEFVARGAKILFTQEHMPFIRRKMVIEIIEGQLLT